jgi:hypothetical protein
MRGVRVTCHLAVVLLCLGLPNCAIVDQYSDRATTYNVEAEQAQEKALLLNIIRSSQRRPLQFTTVTSIVGSASMTGTGGYSGPVDVPFRVSGGSGSYPPLTTWTAGGSLNGAETFTVPVLDTQEFYQGILKPIPSQYYDLLVQQRYPGDLLFNLFIQKVVVRVDDASCKGKHTEDCEHTFRNYVSFDDDIDQFQMFAHYLIRAGLSTESSDRKESLLKGAMNINLKVLGASTQAAAPGQASGGAAPGSSGAGDPLPKNYSFCFAARNKQFEISETGCGSGRKGAPIALGETAGGSGLDTLVVPGGLGRGALPATVKVLAEERLRGKAIPIDFRNVTINGLPECQKAQYNSDGGLYQEFCAIMYTFAQTNKKVSIAFYTKSTEAVIYYLGEVTRRQLYPDQIVQSAPLRLMFDVEPSADLARCIQSPQNPDRDPDPNHCKYIFRIDSGLIPNPGVIGVFYNGRGYSVLDYGNDGGYSMSSLEIAKQLQALFSSAKTLPSTTVLSVTNQ